MKQYLGISRDHSGSMSSLRNAAMKDYNDTIQVAAVSSKTNDIQTLVSVTIASDTVERDETNTDINRVRPLTSYRAAGGTPLFDSVGKLIEDFQRNPDANDKDVTFLVIAITDGEENKSYYWRHKLGAEVKRLQATDRWTFVFRVPRGYARSLERLGIPSGNIQEWDTTERGLQESSVINVAAIQNYYSGVSRGITASKMFYTDMKDVSSNQVASQMKDISQEVNVYLVTKRTPIEPFFVAHTKESYRKGTAFYSLTKPEKIVQDYKLIVVRNKKSGSVYAGADARSILKLPTVGNISLKPGDHGDWDIYIQSTSTNRILIPGTSALYWKNA